MEIYTMENKVKIYIYMIRFLNLKIQKDNEASFIRNFELNQLTLNIYRIILLLHKLRTIYVIYVKKSNQYNYFWTNL